MINVIVQLFCTMLLMTHINKLEINAQYSLQTINNIVAYQILIK